MTKDRFRSNAPAHSQHEQLAETLSTKKRENSQKPTNQRLLKIAGESKTAARERFNEDAGSVAISVRQQGTKKKLKYNLLGEGIAGK